LRELWRSVSGRALCCGLFFEQEGGSALGHSLGSGRAAGAEVHEEGLERKRREEGRLGRGETEGVGADGIGGREDR